MAPEAYPVQQARAAKGSETILIVDDDRLNRDLIEIHMNKLGYRSVSASNGEEALAQSRISNPDLIILDLMMPGLSGIETCRILRSLDETRHIPIIAITAVSDQDLKMKCLSAGANDFITKPIDSTELMIKIRNLLQIKEFEDIKVKNRSLNQSILLIERAKREWEQTMDCIKDIVILIDRNGIVIRCNRPLSLVAGLEFGAIIRRPWRDVLRDSGFVAHQSGGDALLFSHETGKWFEGRQYSMAPDSPPGSPAVVLTLHDITISKIMTEELRHSHDILEAKNSEVAEAYRNLQAAQSQILQQEKMASIGQLAAGVAHEINNPIGFIISNLNTLRKYLDRLVEFQNRQTEALMTLSSVPEGKEALEKVSEQRAALKIDFMTDDIRNLISESLEGGDRVKKIVQDLKSFSRVDEADNKLSDINAGLESTVNIVWNEIKYKASLVRDYGDIPTTKCNPGQLNQVFMNLLVNAAHAIDKQGEITLRTRHEGGMIHVTISDTGSGIRPDHLARIFEPFFTTKEVGKGTGLGLSIAYDIVKKHGGNIKVDSTVGKGTTFTVSIPVVDR